MTVRVAKDGQIDGQDRTEHRQATNPLRATLRAGGLNAFMEAAPNTGGTLFPRRAIYAANGGDGNGYFLMNVAFRDGQTSRA
jgi:hypothetical protein